MTTPHEPKVRFVVTLEGKRNETAHAHTLRYVLKYLLRTIKCVDAREVSDEQDNRA